MRRHKVNFWTKVNNIKLSDIKKNTGHCIKPKNRQMVGPASLLLNDTIFNLRHPLKRACVVFRRYLTPRVLCNTHTNLQNNIPRKLFQAQVKLSVFNILTYFHLNYFHHVYQVIYKNQHHLLKYAMSTQ